MATLFWKKLFGKLESTANMETREQTLIENYNRYLKIDESAELEEYKELYKLVKSSQFKENKKTLKSRKYKDTQYFHDTRKFEKLEKNHHLNNFFKILESQNLADYLKFKESPDYTRLGNRKEVKKDKNLAKFKAFERSKSYKNYVRFHNSYIIKEFDSLREKINTEDFKKMNSFWANENRWETTKESKLEKRFFELADNADIMFYNDTDVKQFESLSTYDKVLNEQFQWKNFADSQWKAGFNFGHEKMINDYSFINEKQANNHGKNVGKRDGNLIIYTKQEHIQTKAWDPNHGFIDHEYQYTSDLINAKNAILQKEGIFRAKIKFNGSKDITHAFWLLNKGPIPEINIVKYNGKYLEFGVNWNDNHNKQYTSTKISGINPDDFFIYTLKWTKKTLSWYINNVKIFETNMGLPNVPMFPVLSSHIPATKKGGTGEMEVAWIEVYKKNDYTNRNRKN